MISLPKLKGLTNLTGALNPDPPAEASRQQSTIDTLI